MFKKDRFLLVLFSLLVISAAVAYARYMIFTDFIVYTDEADISESVLDQFYNVLNNGL